LENGMHLTGVSLTVKHVIAECRSNEKEREKHYMSMYLHDNNLMVTIILL